MRLQFDPSSNELREENKNRDGFFGDGEIPEKHIVKRWTKDARAILLEHLQHYERDQISSTMLTFRNTTLAFRNNRMYMHWS